MNAPLRAEALCDTPALKLTTSDLYFNAWVDDQAHEVAQAAVSFFRLARTATGELTMAVFGSGVLVTHRDRIMVVTALSVAAECAHGETFMQTAMGAVGVSDLTFSLDRGQLIAACDVHSRVRENAVLTDRTERLVPSNGRGGANRVLCIGYPGTKNAFRKSLRPSSFEIKALLAPYMMGSHMRTTVHQPLFLQWDGANEIKGHGRSEADVRLDPKGMIGGPVYNVVLGSDDEPATGFRGIMVEARPVEKVVIVYPAQALPEFLSHVQYRSVK